MPNENQAVVLSASRRRIKVASENKFYEILIERKYSELLPGDLVILNSKKNGIKEVLERTNLIKRSFKNKTKEIVANVDELWIILAPPPLLNLTVLDRVLCLATLENIVPVLIFNKTDLGYEKAIEIIEYYKKIGVAVDFISAKNDAELQLILKRLKDKDLFQVALCGVSGVGKSTLLQKLVPEVEIRTNEVSEKTGQGKQTTSKVSGYIFNRAEKKEIFLFDLPGIQNFGIVHYEKQLIKQGFIEFNKYEKCEYSDCLHLKEPNCGVKTALAENKILKSRYASYKQILKEIELSKPY